MDNHPGNIHITSSHAALNIQVHISHLHHHLVLCYQMALYLLHHLHQMVQYLLHHLHLLGRGLALRGGLSEA